MSSIDKILFSEIKLLSKQVSAKEPFFQKIACLGKEEAEIIAYCEICKLIFKDKKKLHYVIDNIIIPSFKMLGMVNWHRDVLTEMGLKLGKHSEHGTLPPELEARLQDAGTN